MSATLASPSRAGIALGVIQLALIAWIFSGVRFSNAIATGIADSQLALAVVFLAATGTRWGWKLPLVVGLIGAASLAHQVCLVDLWHPLLFSEEYWVSLLVAASIWVCFFLWRRIANFQLENENLPPDPQFWAWGQFAIRDLLIWMLVVGALIAVGRCALEKNGAAGLFGWGKNVEWFGWGEPASFGIVLSRGFAIVEAPDFLLRRIPLLLVALIAQGIAWTVAARMMLGTPWSWLRLLGVAIVLVVLSITEVGIATGMLLFDTRWAILPASGLPAVLLVADMNQAWQATSTGYYSSKMWDWQLFLAAIFLTRYVVFGGSLLLLRRAGWRLVKKWPPKALEKAAEQASSPDPARKCEPLEA